MRGTYVSAAPPGSLKWYPQIEAKNMEGWRKRGTREGGTERGQDTPTCTKQQNKNVNNFDPHGCTAKYKAFVGTISRKPT